MYCGCSGVGQAEANTCVYAVKLRALRFLLFKSHPANPVNPVGAFPNLIDQGLLLAQFSNLQVCIGGRNPIDCGLRHRADFKNRLTAEAVAPGQELAGEAAIREVLAAGPRRILR
jgi:hypothetical protein